MNRYDDEELIAPEQNPAIGTNIKQLRIEKNLSISELSELTGVSEEDILNFEKGTSIPSKNQIESLIGILRISYYDMMTRDILSERNEITLKMKKSKDRSSYNWFYGSKKKIILNILYLIGVPLLFLIASVFLKNVQNFINESFETEVFTDTRRYILAYLCCSIVSGVLITIELAIRFNYQFQVWHIMWITTLCWIVVIIGAIGTIPYYIYIIVELITKKGKNHR